MTKKKIKYSDEALGEIKLVKDFLPSPEDLVKKEETVKVTLMLSRDSVDFFKKEAQEHHTQYQKMIRSLVDIYAQTYAANKEEQRKYG